ncbi:PLP-dependent aminotransferase family protein [Paenibacillus sp. alder61]|uniref:aminotransferase-like domain-containing protein n=1 Tax=Paenibacillus sp. alder61 TaxID=2862948 RepID=UPI001CD570C8|nr:PLP-dependent aminotransferase family protein [Paenibacillus sp. alder61]MCA1291515.1 PLP-dependent aminotransferase family protein [Paenibacillus sp. alder61]
MSKALRPRDSTGLLFRRVYDYIIDRIEREEWKAHDKLPSVRLLAKEFHIHRLTVLRAYQMLKQNGIVYAREKSGYYVSGNPFGGDTGSNDRTNTRLSVPAYLRNHLGDIHRVSSAYNFSQALIDPTLLPNLFLSEYVKQVFDSYPKLLGTYSSVQGDEELRELLSRYFLRKHRFLATSDEIMITTGAQQAIDLLSRVYLRPMDWILVERPTYSAALDIFRQQGARFLPVDIHPDGYDLEQVETLMIRHKPRLFYMNPTFHNPTGYTVPTVQRKQLVELAEQNGCLIVEDDAFHDIYFDAPPPPPLFSFDTEGWVVYLRSFSKYVAPGLRICAAVARPSVMEPLVTAKSLADNGTPLVNQKLFLHCFESARLQQHLEKLRTALLIRRDTMERALAETGWSWGSPQGGLNLWLRLPAELSVDALLAECFRHSVSFVPGIICDPLRKLESRIRLSYSFANEEQIRIGIGKLAALARSVREFER